MMADIIQRIGCGKRGNRSKIGHRLHAQSAGNDNTIFRSLGDKACKRLFGLDLVAQEVYLDRTGDVLALRLSDGGKAAAIRLLRGFELFEALVAGDDNGNVMKDDNGNPIRIPKVTYYTDGNGTMTGYSTGNGGVAVMQASADGSVEMGENGEVNVYAMTQEQADEILGLINATTAVYGYDESILNIISDEAAAYFAGEKSLDDTANMIQSRVNLYVAEQS